MLLMLSTALLFAHCCCCCCFKSEERKRRPVPSNQAEEKRRPKRRKMLEGIDGPMEETDEGSDGDDFFTALAPEQQQQLQEDMEGEDEDEDGIVCFGYCCVSFALGCGFSFEFVFVFGVDVEDIDITVSDGQDDGPSFNDQVTDFTQSDEFDIDTLNPTITVPSLDSNNVGEARVEDDDNNIATATDVPFDVTSDESVQPPQTYLVFQPSRNPTVDQLKSNVLYLKLVEIQ